MPRFKEEEREEEGEEEEEEKKSHRSKCSVAFSRNLIRSLVAPVVESNGDGNGEEQINQRKVASRLDYASQLNFKR